MNKPLRLKIIEALVARLKEITVASGYNFDLNGADQVTYGRSIFGEDDPLPSVSLLEDTNPPAPDDTPAFSEETARTAVLSLYVQGWVETPVQSETNGLDQAYYLLADVQAKFAELIKEKKDSPNQAILNDLVDKLKVGAVVVRPPDDMSDVSWFWLRVVLEYTEDLSDPTWVPYSDA